MKWYFDFHKDPDHTWCFGLMLCFFHGPYFAIPFGIYRIQFGITIITPMPKSNA